MEKWIELFVSGLLIGICGWWAWHVEREWRALARAVIEKRLGVVPLAGDGPMPGPIGLPPDDTPAQFRVRENDWWEDDGN